uniref:Uncharacterized protein n=1 Tax=viral metagenome TaxID=1070528 RepID=A0A6C0JW93_9ZZZZ
MTPEEKLERTRKRKREWARRNKDTVKRKTYSERTAGMSMPEYIAFLEKQKERTQRWRDKQKELKNSTID